MRDRGSMTNRGQKIFDFTPIALYLIRIIVAIFRCRAGEPVQTSVRKIQRIPIELSRQRQIEFGVWNADAPFVPSREVRVTGVGITIMNEGL
jgi:hypothetical protein